MQEGRMRMERRSPNLPRATALIAFPSSRDGKAINAVWKKKENL
jgi:hypothetical protein